MRATFSHSYPKIDKNGNPVDVFVFHVTGSEEELAMYKKVQGSNYRQDKDSGKPLFFDSRWDSGVVDLIFTQTGRVVQDRSMQRKANSLIRNNEFLRDAVAERMLNAVGFGQSRSNRTVGNPQEGAPVDNGGNIDPFKQ